MPSSEKTLKELLKIKDYAIELGVEVETEASAGSLPADLCSGWLGHVDGSLRGISQEYVSSNGKYSTMKGSLTALFSAMNRSATIVTDSPRTSMHVHHRIMDMTPRQFITAMSVLLVYEDVFVTFCGVESRKGNSFCATALDKTENVGLIVKALDPSQFLRINNKYSFTNLTPVRSRGSLEMRGLEFTQDIDRIMAWINGIKSILTKAPDKYAHPGAFLNDLVARGERDVLKDLLYGSKLFPLIRVAEPDWDGTWDAVASLEEFFEYTEDWDRYFKEVNDFDSKTGKAGPAPIYTVLGEDEANDINSLDHLIAAHGRLTFNNRPLGR